MYWPGEDSVSVVPRSKLLTGDMEGSKYTIKMGKSVHEGEIIGVGKQLCAW